MKFALLMLIASVSAIKLTAEDFEEPTELAEAIEDEFELEDEEHRGPTAAQIMKYCDKNGDGKISRREMHRAIRRLAKKHHFKVTKAMRKEADRHFKAADKNHDGKIGMKELKAAMKKHGK